MLVVKIEKAAVDVDLLGLIPFIRNCAVSSVSELGTMRTVRIKRLKGPIIETAW